jgi:HEAT repeat protein
MTEQTTSFQVVLDALQESKKDFPKRYLPLFSDIAPLELQTLLEIWPRINLTRKLTLLNGLVSLMDTDMLVSFEDIGWALLDDSEGDVRACAIRLLAESDDEDLAESLIEILRNDPDLDPRLEAAKLLGEFILLGELEKLDGELHREAEETLMGIVSGEEHASLRKLALESVGYSSRMEVETLIRTAFNRADPTWVASALIAMGRSSDEQWDEDVVSMLLNDDPRIRLAAVQAAGDLRSENARPIILGMLLEGEEDEDDVIAAGIWSLSQIGGEDVRAFLTDMLDRTEDEDVVGFIEDALENLDLTDDLEKFDLLALNEEELDDLNEVDEDE